MKKSDKAEKNNIVFSFLRTYLIVLFIPLVICSLYCVRILSIIEEDDAAKAVEEFRYSAASVDSLLGEVDGIGKLLVDNAYVKRFANEENGFVYPRTYKIIELQDFLPDISFTDDYIYDYFIFFDKSEVVINRSSAYTYEDFYDLYFHEERFATYEEWYRQKRENRIKYGVDSVQDYYFGSEDATIPMLAYELPLATYTIGDKSVAKIYIKKDAITSRMPALADNSLQFIQNAKGDIIYSESNGMQFILEDILKLTEEAKDSGIMHRLADYGGEQYLFVKCYSEQSDLTYYLLQPSFAIRARGLTVVLYMLLLILFAAIIGIVLSVQMSYKAVKPISELLHDALEAGSEYEHKNIFSHLGKSYKKLKDTNTELHEAIEVQKPFLQNVFLDQLLYGNFGLEEDMKKNAEYVNFEYQGKVFWTVIFKVAVRQEVMPVNDVNVQSLYILSVAEAIKKVMPGAWLVHSGEEKLVAIMSLPTQQGDAYKQYTEELVPRVKEELIDVVAKQLSIYGGTVVADMSEINASYENATIMQIYKQQKANENVIWYVKQKTKTVSYPSTEKNKILLHYVLSGEVDEVYKSFKEMMEQIFIEDNYTSYMQNLLIDDLQINLVRIMEVLDIDEEKHREFYLALENNHSANILERIRITQNLYLQISQYVYEQKTEKTLDISAITAYLQLNFGNCDLSLTSAAEAFQVSEGYLSSMFKQETGINFSNYIEKLRMDKAKELLKNGDMSIKEISNCVGYTSENSFCRAFKRVVGMNTSEWRTQERL